MNKILTFLIGAIVVGIITVVFFLQPKELPQITDGELNRVFDVIMQHGGEESVEEYGPFLNENYLINLVHIAKYGSDYKVSCRFGPAHETANLYKLFPEELVSLGQIKNCDIETARAIDEAIYSLGLDCRVFLNSGNIPFLSDYYFFSISIAEGEVTQEMIDRSGEKQCLHSLKELKGTRMTTHIFTGMVDLKEGRIFY